MPAKEVRELGGECGAIIWPLRISVSPSKAEITGYSNCAIRFRFDAPRRSRVFPDPNFPQMRDISPGGNFSVRSMRMNLYLGVETTDDATLD